jgi:protein-tyrosine kinase
MSANPANPEQPGQALIVVDEPSPDHHQDRRLIGEELVQSERLDPNDRDLVLRKQEEHGGRFGEIAIQLGVLTRNDVLWALSRQFHHARNMPDRDTSLSSELVMVRQAFSDEVERFRDLRSQLLMTAMNGQGDRGRTLAVVSANVGDGKTFLSSNLAVAFSHLPGRTLIIDCDMRSPRLHRVFALESRSGLSDLLSGRAVSNIMHAVEGLPNLYVLPVGVVPPNPLELIEGPAFRVLLAEVSAKFDYVLLDTPAASHGSDALVVASCVGSALIVGRQDHTQSKRLQQLVGQLGRASVRVAGIVMNEA